MLLNSRVDQGRQQRSASNLTVINWGHPSARQLRGAIVVGSDFGARELVAPVIDPKNIQTAAWAYGTSPGGQAIKFNNTNAAGWSLGARSDWNFNSGVHAGTGDFTIHCRVVAPTANTNQTINVLGKTNSQTFANAVNWSWGMFFRNVAGSYFPQFFVGNGTTFQGGDFGASALTPGVPYDITVVGNRTLTTMKMFVNGVQTPTTITYNITPSNNSNTFYVQDATGAADVGTWSFVHGFIWTRALQAAEVFDIAQRPYALFVPNQMGLLPPQTTIVTPAVVIATAAVPVPVIDGADLTTSPAVVSGTATAPAARVFTLTPLFAPTGASNWLLSPADGGTANGGTATQTAGDVALTTDNTANSLGRAKAISGGVGVDFTDFDGYFTVSASGGAEFGGAGTTQRYIWMRASDTYTSATTITQSAQGVAVEVTATAVNLRDNSLNLLQTVAKTLTAGTLYDVRLMAKGPNVRLKVWPNAQTEPAAWDINYAEPLYYLNTYSTTGKVKAAIRRSGSGDTARTFNVGRTFIEPTVTDTIELIGESRVASTGSSSITPTTPINAVNGDVLIAVVANGANEAQGNFPGWTLIASDTNAATGVGIGIYWRIHSTATSSWTYSGTAASTRTAVVLAYRGLDQHDPHDVISAANKNDVAGATHTAPTLTTGYASDLVVRAVAKLNGAANSLMTAFPAGNRTLQDFASATTAAATEIAISDSTQTAIGAAGTATFTSGTAEKSVAFTDAFRPAQTTTTLFQPHSDGSWGLSTKASPLDDDATMATAQLNGDFGRVESWAALSDYELTHMFEMTNVQGFGGSGSDTKFIALRSTRGGWSSGTPTGGNVYQITNTAYGPATKALSGGTLYRTRIRQRGMRTSIRVWQDGLTEPSTWDYETVENTFAIGTATPATPSGHLKWSLANNNVGNAGRTYAIYDVLASQITTKQLDPIAGAGASGTATSVTVTLPSNLVDGDLVLFMLGTFTTTSTAVTSNVPAGWTLIQSGFSTSSRSGIFQKIWHTGDATTVTFTDGISVAKMGWTLVVRDELASGPINASAVTTNVASGGPYIFPSVTTTVDGCAIYHVALGQIGFWSSLGTDTFNPVSIAGSPGVSAALREQTSAGATGTTTWTASSNSNASLFTIAIAPFSPNATVLPAAVVATATVPAPTITIGTTVTPTEVAAVTTIPNVFAGNIEVVSPASVTGIATVPAPSVQTSQTVTVATVVGVATVPGPVIIVPTPITAGLAQAYPSSFIPNVGTDSVFDSGVVSHHVTVHPARVISVTAVQAPTIGSGGPYASAVSADSPTIYWRLGESSGTTAADSSGNGHTGTYNGSPIFGNAGLQTSDSDSATYFISTSNHYAKADADLAGTYGAYSLEVIFKMTIEPASYGHVWGVDSTAGGFLALEIYGPDSAINWFTGVGVSPQTPIALDTVYHVVGTWDGTTARLYLNGVEVDTGTGSGSNTLGAADFFYVGSDDFDELFDGPIDEAAFYTTALSAGQVLAHFNASGI